MPLNTDYSDHGKTLIMIETAQSGEQLQREQVKEQKIFLTDKDGQWEQRAKDAMDGRFRGTFDMVSPIIEGFEGEVINAAFTIRVSPSNGTATKDTAKLYDGIIRNIRNISNAEDIFDRNAVSNYIGGFDCFEIVQEYVDGNSFDQDLLFKDIANAVDSVWFDPSSIKQDRSDANWAIKLMTIPMVDYKADWPDGGGISIGDNSQNHKRVNKNTNDTVTIGQLYYKKETETELVKMSDGSVYVVNEKFESIVDDMANPLDGSDPVIEKRRRKRKLIQVHSRMLDGSDWLKDAQKTVFIDIPLCPIYGNYDIIDDSYVYFGKVLKLMDPQRVYNYAASRDIEDGALGMSEKIAMTEKQVEGNDYTKLNTGNEPILIYSPDENVGANAPYKLAATQPSAALQTTMVNMQQMVNTTSNTFQSQQGNAAATQSGIAGLQQIEQANVGTTKWMKASRIQLCYAAKVLLPAIPLVYDGERQTRILDEGGISEIVTLNRQVLDAETQTNVVLNDLTKGRYDAVCDMGPAYNSAQKESARSLEATLSTNPELGSVMLDVLFKNKNEPGMEIIAERLREIAFNNNVIPKSQWTEEERQKVAEQQAQSDNQPPQEDPAVTEARGIELSGQADLQNAQTKQSEAQFNAQVKSAQVTLEQDKVALDREKLQFEVQKFIKGQDDKFNVDAAKVDQGQQSLDQKNQKMLIDVQQSQDRIDLQSREQGFNQLMEAQEAMTREIKTNAESFKIMAEAMQTFVGPGIVEAGIKQAEVIQESQENAGATEIDDIVSEGQTDDNVV